MKPVIPPCKQGEKKIGAVKYGDILSFAIEALDQKAMRGEKRDG